MPVITKEQLENASLDAADLADFVNAAAGDVDPRLGDNYPNLRKLINQILDGGGLRVFEDETALQAYEPELPTMALTITPVMAWKYEGALPWVEVPEYFQTVNEMAVTNRAASTVDVYAIEREASLALRVWGGAGIFQEEGVAAKVIPATGEVQLSNGEACFFRKDTLAIENFMLTAVSPDWQTNGEYVLLFANLGGNLVGNYKDKRQVDDFYIEKDANYIFIYGPELEPYSNRCVRLTWQYVLDTTKRIKGWRRSFDVLCKRTGNTTYGIVAIATDEHYAREFEIQVNNKAPVSFVEGNVEIISTPFIFVDGKRYTDTNLTIRGKRFGIGQHVRYYEPGTAAPGVTTPGTDDGYHSDYYEAYIENGDVIVDYQCINRAARPISIDKLWIGTFEPKYNSTGIGCFDTLICGPEWLQFLLNDSAFTEHRSQDNIIKYVGAGINVGAGPSVVAGKGLTCHIEIMPGSEWFGEDCETIISPTIYGTTFFNWAGHPFASVVPTGNRIKGRIQNRFSFNA